jgi:hypothetical protein
MKFLFILLTYSAAIFSAIWSIADFIIYLVKDKPFNYYSIISFFFFGIVTFLAVVLKALSDKPKIDKTISPKLQQRMDEMKRQYQQQNR